MSKISVGSGARVTPCTNETSASKPLVKVGSKHGGVTLGLAAFEKISAVEGIHLDDEMRRDLERIERGGMNEIERSRFVLERYGKP